MSLHDLSEINPHLALWRSENYVSPVERAWERWVRQVEGILGHGLDGDEYADGYSLDFAYGAFEAGETTESYVTEVICVVMERDRAFGPCLQFPPRS